MNLFNVFLSIYWNAVLEIMFLADMDFGLLLT